MVEVFYRRSWGFPAGMTTCMNVIAMDDNIAAMCCIDWQRGKPYIFRLADYDMLA